MFCLNFCDLIIYGSELSAISNPLLKASNVTSSITTASGQMTHLIVADGYRRVQKVADLSQVLETFCLQLHPLTVGLLYRFVYQQTHLFDLVYCQGLPQRKKRQTNVRSFIRSVCQLLKTSCRADRKEHSQSYRQSFSCKRLQVLCFVRNSLILSNWFLLLLEEQRTRLKKVFKISELPVFLN